MVSGGISIILLFVAVIFIILGTAKLRMNAFFVLLIVAYFYGLAIGMDPLVVIATIKKGFGGLVEYMGIVILSGAVLGTFLEKTGAAISMTNFMLKLVGKKRAPLAMSIGGYFVSIPVFCDAGFIVLNPLTKSLSKETGISMTVLAIALSTGLYATHGLVPPTPGPIAASAILGADIGQVILFGLLVSLPATFACLFWANIAGKKYTIIPEDIESYDIVIQKYGKLPSTFHAFLPILYPLIAILLKSLAEFPTHPFGEGKLQSFIRFMGDPTTALLCAVLLCFTLVKKEDLKNAMSDWMSKGIKDAAIVFSITAAGGAFGQVLKASPMVDFIGTTMTEYNLGLFLPFIVAATLKTAQGSSTVAILTTASIMAPLLTPMGLHPAVTVLAIGSGAMVVSHANDSYFWVVSQFSNIDVKTSYKLYTTATLIEGIVAFIGVLILSIFL